jgi:hypothetical protein
MRWRVLVGLAVMVGLGCGGESYRLAPVSGRVTVNGKPLANATVTFQPIGSAGHDPGPGSYGRTDADGNYTLRVVEDKRNGAVVGNHRVSISTQGGGRAKAVDDDMEIPRETLPARYNAESTLAFTVPREGASNADFPLTAP